MQLFSQKVSADLAKALTIMCFRNTEIENIHAGIWPSSKTGDYKDVRVIDGYGNEFTWDEISRVSDEEMEVLNKNLVNRLYTFLMQGRDKRFGLLLEHHLEYASMWDEPEIDYENDCRRDRDWDLLKHDY